MSIARGELLKPAPVAVERYVYVRMIRANVDATVGKLKVGDIVTLPESKAIRWVYRARIAVPATRDEYLAYTKTAGSDRKGFLIPESPAFEYVEPDYTPQEATSSAEVGEPAVANPLNDSTLADKLDNLTVEDAAVPDPVPRQHPGVFNQAIERGPQSDPRREDRRPDKNRNR